MRRRAVTAVAVTVMLLAAGGVTLYMVTQPSGDEAAVHETVDRFMTAVDSSDISVIVSLLCEEEAESITEDDDTELDEDVPEPPVALPREISDVRVNGDHAAAEVSRPNQDPYTLYLRREGGRWQICADGESAFTQ